MWHLHNNKLIDDEVYGSCKGKTGSKALITLQLLADHSRVWKKNLILLFNNAAGCYDRIPPALAEIALRRVGVPKQITKAHTNAQRKMKHHIKTAIGVSTGYIQCGNVSKRIIIEGLITLLAGIIGGIGQGGRASPIIWLVILLIMMKVYRMTQEGAIVEDSITKEKIPLHIISYVDNNSIVRHFERKETVATMMEKIKENIGEWQKLLQLMGGDLSLDKCKVTVMKWYQNGEWGRIKLKKKTKEDDKLIMTSIKNVNQEELLERLDPNDAERVLGIRLPLDGSMTAELAFRKKQLKTFCTALYKSPLTQKEAYSAYQSRYKSIATYPYTVTIFTTRELAKIQKDSLNLLLPKLGIN